MTSDIIENITLIHADCMTVLSGLQDNAFDLAIVDPPYFSGPERRQFYGKSVSTTGVRRVSYEKSDTWHVPTAEYFDELRRVARYYIIWGCNYYDYVFAHGRIVWDKCNGTSSFSDCEIAATNLFESVRLFPFMWNGMLQGRSMTDGRTMQGNKRLNEKRIHPTQKPVALYAWLLTQYAVAASPTTPTARAGNHRYDRLVKQRKEVKMMTETIYHPDDLHSGKCEWCGQESDELIYTENDEEICIDCYEDQKFFQETMRGI